jgi:Thrombospondin type 1 domain
MQAVNDSFCDSNPPITREPCNQHECPNWHAGEWSACLGTCHNSKRNRTVICVYKNTQVESYQCRDSPKPTETEQCERIECPIWKTSEWSKCSTDCGKGMRSRLVYCEIERHIKNVDTNTYLRRLTNYSIYNLISSEKVDEKYCDQLNKPVNESECFVPVECQWRVGNWTACSVSCGSGHRMRIVNCSSKLPNSCSAEAKPSNYEVCIMPPCQNKWKVGNWSEVGYHSSKYLYF